MAAAVGAAGQPLPDPTLTLRASLGTGQEKGFFHKEGLDGPLRGLGRLGIPGAGWGIAVPSHGQWPSSGDPFRQGLTFLG